MAKDMENGEVREFQGKEYMYKEIEAMETDYDWEDCCDDCSLKNKCIGNAENAEKTIETLGECYEETRLDGRNGIFVEVE